jgi:hypothetical protein
MTPSRVQPLVLYLAIVVAQYSFSYTFFMLCDWNYHNATFLVLTSAGWLRHGQVIVHDLMV